MTLPWPVRSVLAGTAGTATMTLAYGCARRLRRSGFGPLDYDDSLLPGQIVATAMHLSHVTDRQDHELGLMLRWSYGSAFGLLHGELRRVVPEPWASATPVPGSSVAMPSGYGPSRGNTTPGWSLGR